MRKGGDFKGDRKGGRGKGGEKRRKCEARGGFQFTFRDMPLGPAM